MQQRIDLDRIYLIYRQALRALPETMDGQAPGAQVCPMALEELLAEV